MRSLIVFYIKKLHPIAYPSNYSTLGLNDFRTQAAATFTLSK